MTYVRGFKTSGIGNATLNLFEYVGLAAKALPINTAPKMNEEPRKNLAISAKLEKESVCWIYKDWNCKSECSTDLDGWMVVRRSTSAVEVGSFYIQLTDSRAYVQVGNPTAAQSQGPALALSSGVEYISNPRGV